MSTEWNRVRESAKALHREREPAQRRTAEGDGEVVRLTGGRQAKTKKAARENITSSQGYPIHPEAQVQIDPENHVVAAVSRMMMTTIAVEDSNL